jgi:5S rRNA maturation endonuclease (ribonuclease M5)
MSSVTKDLRHTSRHRCPICGGAESDPRGQGKRCSGFTSQDEQWAQCSREEKAGAIEQNDAGLFAHILRGPCRCGVTHGFNRDADTGTRLQEMIEAVYDYRDENDVLRFQVVRRVGKKFLQRAPDGNGGWFYKLAGVRRIPYRLRQLSQIPPDVDVYWVEGEKDVASLERAGFVATTSAQGAKSWRFTADEAKRALAGRKVHVIADADKDGRAYAREVASSLAGVVASIDLWECPAPHKDISDLLGAGGSIDDLVLVEISQAAPPQKSETNEPWEAGPPDGFVEPEPEPEEPAPTLADDAIPVVREWLVDPLPSRRWLLSDRRTGKGMLPAGKAGQIIAEGGAGKTMALIQLALAVASGGVWLDTFPVNIQGRVLLVLGEEDAEEARRRVYAAARKTDPASIPTGSIVILPLAGKPCAMLEHDQYGNPIETAFFLALREIVKSEEWALIIIDPLSRFAGLDAEKDNAEATRFVQACEAFCAIGGAVVLVAHHTNKASRGSTPLNGASGRGSSALHDGFRWQCALSSERVEDEDIVTLSFTKSNYSLRGADLLLRREEGGPLAPLDDAERDDLMVAKDKAAKKEDTKQKLRNRAHKVEDARLRELLTQQPGCSLRTIRAVLGINHARADQAIARVNPRIEPGGPRGTNRHFLPGENGGSKATQVSLGSDLYKDDL